MLEKDEEDQLDDCVRSEEVVHRVNERGNILLLAKSRTANWIGHILRRNCPLKQIIEGKIRGRICDGKTRKKA
jgi:hypothetical protein